MARAIILLAALLSGCASGARDIKLSDVDLSNMTTVQNIRSRLTPNEGVAFANFVVRHRIGSAGFCGQPLLDTKGRAPATIGDAIDLALLRDAAERQATIEARRPKHPRQLAMEEWDRLVFARDVAIDAQSRIRTEYGEGAERRPEWKKLELRLTDINHKLVRMKPELFGD